MVCVFLLKKWRESTQYSSDLAFWDKGIEIIVLKEMQGRSSQATRDFDVCSVDMVTNEHCFIRICLDKQRRFTAKPRDAFHSQSRTGAIAYIDSNCRITGHWK